MEGKPGCLLSELSVLGGVRAKEPRYQHGDRWYVRNKWEEVSLRWAMDWEFGDYATGKGKL